jgi:ABC-2 type transport system permease protein/lipopolysaccharide transport system permease protein
MLMYVTGLGLMVAILYIRYDDTRSIFGILISFMMYLSPIFYPKEILSDQMLKIRLPLISMYFAMFFQTQVWLQSPIGYTCRFQAY